MQKHERRISRREQKGRQSSYVAVCAKIAINGGGEREPTQDSTFRAGHEPTQTDTRNRRGESVQPASPYEVYHYQKHTIQDVTSDEDLGGTSIEERHAPVWRPLQYVFQIW